MKRLRVGIIGCGAVTEQMYVPAITALASVEISALVDTNIARAEKLATGIKDVYLSQKYQEIFDKVDAVVIALPHMLHSKVAIDCLKQGIHVLVEKPMAMNVKECDQLLETADNTQTILAVGLIRRFYNSSRLIKQILDDGWLGEIRSFDFREGFIYNWPIKSDFPFRKEAGGGVLYDTGAHVLDLLLWWLGDYETIEYYDDSFGGVEANGLLELRLKNGVCGTIELSRTRKLRNTFQIIGEKASLEVGTYFNSSIFLNFNGRLDLGRKITMSQFSQKDFLDIACQQIEDFVKAVIDKRKPFINGIEAKRSIFLIENCLSKRMSLKQPWMDSYEKI